MAESSTEGEQGGTVFRSKSKIPAKRKSQTNLSAEYKVEEKKSRKSIPSPSAGSYNTSSTSHYNLRPRVCSSSSTVPVTASQSSTRIQSTKTLTAKKSSSSPSLSSREAEKVAEKPARPLKKTQRETPKVAGYSASASALPYYNLTSTSPDTTTTFKSKVAKTDPSHKSASDSRLSSKLSFLRASLTSGAHRGRDLGNHPSSEGSRGSQPSFQTQRGDQPKPEGSRRSQRTTEATGSCASNSSRRGSQTKKRTWSRRQQPSMSTEDGSSEQGAASGQPRFNEAAQSSSSAAERNEGNTNSHSDDNELKDSDMSRLQSLLEARGVPPHLFGSLGPRMHQLLHRASNNSSNSKAQQLLQGIQSSDEGQQLQAVIEMCQLLVMGNEESLAGFPVKQAVPALINLLNKEQKFELVNHACRALTYLMESLPRSTMVVVEAIPAFLEKLQSIECMDVAEQSLTALDMLSKRHGKAILQAGGMSTCLLYLDFFSISAQRSALAIAANCCSSVGPDDFHYVADAIETLSTQLQIQDKKSVESCCLAFSRLVDSFQNDKKHLKDLSAHGLLTNIQQLLMIFPPIISTGTFVMVLRMLSLLCSNCPDLAVDLIKNNIVETLRFLLFGSVGHDLEDNFELITRSPQEFFELTCFISELFPKLPQTGVFSVDALLNKSQQRSEHGLWQWRDDRGVWHSYSWIDSKIIEAAYHSGEDELSLATMGRTYTIDLNAMQQINEDTGTTRPVQRCNGSGESSSTSSSKAESVKVDSRIAILQEDSSLEDRELSSFTYQLFSCLYSILNSSVGIAIRNRCVNAILRMIYYAPAELLQVILKQHPISSIIGGMLQSHDIRTLVNALQLAEILMQKLPDIFHISFRREGVMHKAKSLASGSFLEASLSSQGKDSKKCCAAAPVVAREPYSSHCSHPIQVFEKPPSPPSRLGDVFRGKRRSKRNPRCKEKCQSMMMEPDLKKQTEVTHLTKSVNLPTTSSLSHHSKPSFFSSLTSSRWNAKASTSSLSSSSDGLPRVDVNSLNTTLHALSTSRMSDNKEKIRTWIKEQAVKFCATYFDEEQGKSHPALDILQKLSNATENLATNNKEDTDVLKVIRSVLSDSEEGASPFEILHSGLVPQLLKYLTLQTAGYQYPLESRLKRFLQAFMDLPESGDVTAIPLNDQKKPPLASFVAKLHSCVNQVEQFPVKVHDAPTGSSGATGSRGSQALRFFSTHQIKCHLQRHPDCKTLKQWKGGPVKIDPLALVQAVERYLVVRGYGKLKEAMDDLDGSEDDGSDDEIDESLALELQGESMPRHHLEIMIGDRVLPYNMTVYQAIKQYGQTDEDKDTEEDQGVLGRPSIWVGQHTIWFRPLPHGGDSPTGNSRLRGGSTSRSSSRTSLKRSFKDELGPSSISQALSNCFPSDLGISDPSIEVICLMRALHILNNIWPLLFESNENNPLISNNDFINSKLSAKILRQLQDPIAVMTGNYPSWIEDLPKKCPFLFPFECRQQLFFSTAFDRERAMSKLQETVPDLINTEMSDRVAPRLDRKKHTVSRKDLFTQAEKIIQDLGSSQSILEIQYEGEVGTGLGPTLEFYTLTSKEFLKSSMEMWRGSAIAPPPTEGAEEGVTYVYSPSGLFPAPIPKNTKAATLTKLRTKFRFLGRFLGRAVLDFRMIDIPLSEAFYKWVLGVENTFDCRDLQHVDPTLARSIGQLQSLVRQKKRLEEDVTLTPESLQLAIENLTLDGVSVEDLGLDFILPGYPGIELKKNGRNIPVTIHNLEEYIKLVVHWTFVEGVERQFQAFHEGFDSVFSLANLNGFSSHEMDLLLCGSGGEKWDVKHLVDCCRPDHGYTHDSRAIKNLFEILNSYDQDQQRLFLQFVTGSPRLPVGGFRSLNPPLTIVRKTFEPPLSADNYLPSVMTCVNYLKLPDYSTKEIMDEKLKIAAHEGQRSFHLS